MSMIGKLRQVSEFELAKFKTNPTELVRALAHSSRMGDPQAYAQLRQNLEQSAVVQNLMEMWRQGKAPTKEQQLEMRQQMQALMKQAGGMQRAAFGKAPRPASAEQASPDELDLHKSWHCLHYLFTGKVEGSDGSPIGEAVLGGAEIGGEEADTGYGPPRALSPTQVKNVAAALEAFPIDEKISKFDPAAADQAGVYVAQHGAEELKEYFVSLRDFYEDAASKDHAVLLWIE